MIQGIFTASQGMTVLLQKQEQFANNLANINTTGFKESGLFAQAYQKYLANDQLQPYANREIKPDEVHINFTEGPMNKTDNPLDCTIRGSGFFTIMTPEGVRYTRNGHFSTSSDGFLVDGQGARVMSTEGFVRLDKMEPVLVSAEGRVMQGNDTKGQLRIADFQKPYKLTREGDSYFKPVLPDNPEVASTGFGIRQGFLEASNVNTIRNMVQMIASFRNYEADQKALLSQDDTLAKAVNEVGKV
jgi:flagellar basal-body rod protein FlgF